MPTENLTYTLHELLVQRNSRLRIPSYQRAYTWDKDEWQVFADDLLEQATSVYAHENNYYLGHFLFEPERDKRIGLIDGQQRLTTAMLFTAAVLFQLPSQTNDLYQQGKLLLMEGITPRLEVVSYDQQVFERLLQRAIRRERKIVDGRTTNAQSKMARAIDFFVEWLKGQVGDTGPQLLDDLLRTLLRAQVTTYTVVDAKQAAQLFELQNDRGRTLTDVEKLKSYLIYQLHLKMPAGDAENAINQVHRHFETIFRSTPNITGLSEDDLLRYYFYAQHGGYRNEPVLQVLKNQVKTGELSAYAILDFSEQLSSAFEFVSSFQKKGRHESVDNLLMLKSYPNVIYPFLLRGYFQLHADSATADIWPAMVQLSGVLEKLVFRLALVGTRARIIDRLRWLLINLPLDALTFEQQLAEAMEGSGYWSNQALLESLQRLSYTDRSVAHYLLWQYERSLQKKGYTLTVSDVNLNELEHIAPQTENPGRRTGYERYHETKFHQAHRDLLGNLLLITRSHNGSIGNIPFADKLTSYQDTPLAQQREILRMFKKDEPQLWGLKQIVQRHIKLVEWATDRWRFKEA